MRQISDSQRKLTRYTASGVDCQKACIKVSGIKVDESLPEIAIQLSGVLQVMFAYAVPVESLVLL